MVPTAPRMEGGIARDAAEALLCPGGCGEGGRVGSATALGKSTTHP